MKKIYLLFIFFFSLSGVFAQSITQTIKGKVFDKDSKSPLPGVSIGIYKDSVLLGGGNSDENGSYKITGIPLGKHRIKATFMGYLPYSAGNIEFTTAKEVVLNFDMEESSLNLKEVEISAGDKMEAKNEMAQVSARSFTIEETNRYAGSRGDPARMASNFAGVQGANDSRNDIVIRGNSPSGVLYRLEGIDIPNPNHFAVAGTSGGPVSILNNKVLDNSDFLTGAFPAEYGNSTSGVFDLKMRNGNNEKYEFTGQFGFLGTELTSEGPISKKSGASYIINYRYSTLKLFEALKISIGTSAVPSYQDGSFKLNFPLKKNWNLSLFGIGGTSNINILMSKLTEPSNDLYGGENRDQHFSTSMTTTGISLSKQHGTKAFSKLIVAHAFSRATSVHELIYRAPDFSVDSLVHKLGYTLDEHKGYVNYYYNYKINAKNTVKAGILNTFYQFNFVDSNYNEYIYKYYTREDYKGNTFLIQPFVQWKYKFSDNFSVSSGIHYQYLHISGSQSIEPRIGAKYNINNKNALSFGTGLHSQMQPTYVYFHQIRNSAGEYYKPNTHLDFTKSAHAVLGYDFFPKPFFRVKMEIYYQYLYNIPVDPFKSSFSIINQGSSFSRYFPVNGLFNKGDGQNLGTEFTVERFFSKSFFFLATVSLYDSKYRGSDKVWRNTDYNNRFSSNLMVGKEFKLKERMYLNLGTKITYAGGRLYSPVDIAATSTNINGDVVIVDSLRNTLRFKSYFRTDLRVSLKINGRKFTHEVALDLVNIFNTKNVLSLTYAPDPANPSADPMIKEYQLGFLPLFYYKIDF